MKTHKNLYQEIISLKNLILAWKKARKGKTRKDYVVNFEKELGRNIKVLHEELKNYIYFPKPMQTFILRDPKTRKISKSDFRDRIVHHALCNIIEPIFDKTFIYDNCANRKGKGSLFALKRFDFFKRKVTYNLSKEAYCFKADIKHYFKEINQNILLEIIERKINCKETTQLIINIVGGGKKFDNKGMPLGNLTSQFFANLYLNELNKFVKHKLRAKYYIRYVDDFVLLHKSKEQLVKWKNDIEFFLKEKLNLELHKDKSKIISLLKGVDFVGFRNFYHFRLLRKRNVRCINKKIDLFHEGKISYEKMGEIFQGWNSYSKWANSYKLKKKLANKIFFSEI